MNHFSAEIIEAMISPFSCVYANHAWLAVSSFVLIEFNSILHWHKDIPENVHASKEWLQRQPDFDGKCTLYENTIFGYDPTNVRFQEAAQFFWSRYSLELDSWRDQPLWCYTLQHCGNLQPIPFEWRNFFVKDHSRKPANGHFYNQTADNNAIHVEET